MKQKIRKAAEKMNTLDKVLICLAIFIFAFVVATMIIYTYNGWQFDTLITMVLSGGGLEAIATAVIQISKYKRGQKESEDEE